jgi:hypothetical protein
MPIDVNARTRLLQAFAAVTSLVVTGALAQTAPAPAANGAMQFKNVTVINAPGRTSRSPQLQDGFRAYLDPATGQLAEPDHEAVATLDLKLPPEHHKPPTKMLARYRLANGMNAVRLDERFLNFSVARRTPGGTLESTCVFGDDLADQLVRESQLRSDDGGQ